MVVVVVDEEMTCLSFTIGHRKAFANAAALGLGVTELKTGQDKKAVEEISMFYDWIYSTCEVTTK